MADRQDRRAFFRELAQYGALGFEMAIAVVIGLAVGYALDRWLGTSPWLTLLWLGFGFAAGVRGLFRGAKRAQKAIENDEERKRKSHGE